MRTTDSIRDSEDRTISIVVENAREIADRSFQRTNRLAGIAETEIESERNDGGNKCSEKEAASPTRPIR